MNVDIEYLLDGYIPGGGENGKDLAIEINGNYDSLFLDLFLNFIIKIS